MLFILLKEVIIINGKWWDYHPFVRTGNQLTLGERSADKVRNFFGSWTFIWCQTIIVLGWIAYNIVNGHAFDPYPFILLNLAFSTQAAYASPLILLSQKRSDQTASEVAQATFSTAKEDLDADNQQVKLLSDLTTTVAQLRNEIAEIKGGLDTAAKLGHTDVQVTLNTEGN